MMVYFLISFLSSIVGAICGIGGGVIIKPVLDLFQLCSVSTASFLSGCTVLCMTCYTVSRSLLSGEKRVDLSTGTPLAIGAALGGVAGKALFDILKDSAKNADAVGGIQAVCLGIITLGTLLYTVKKSAIHTRQLHGLIPCLVLGAALGLLSSFLGIGGGPINLMVLHYFFSYDSKTAAANSLYIILFSQITSLLTTLLGATIPAFAPLTLLLMALGGIGGGIVGRAVNTKIDNQAVDKLFLALMAVIILICVYNSIRYLA